MVFIGIYSEFDGKQQRKVKNMLLKNGWVHDGLGHVEQMDLLVEDGKIAAIGKNLPGEGEDISGCHVLPGLVDMHTEWGINGSMTEIRPSSQDNNENSDPVTPELDVCYAFNGRAISVQQLPMYGITAVGVAPSDSNIFGGQMAAFVTDGVNPFKMLLKDKTGMKASVSREVKQTYGKRNVPPMTKMRIFQMFGDVLRQATEHDAAKEGVVRNEKLAAIRRVIDGAMPLCIAADCAEDRKRVMEIVAPYENVRVIFTTPYGLSDLDLELDPACVAMIDGFCGMDCDPRGLGKDYSVLTGMMEKGIPVVLSCMAGQMYGRETLMWEAAEMGKHIADAEKVISMMTAEPARLMGIGDATGSIEVGKRADIVVWSENPVLSFRARVMRTMIAGKTVYREGDAKKCYI